MTEHTESKLDCSFAGKIHEIVKSLMGSSARCCTPALSLDAVTKIVLVSQNAGSSRFHAKWLVLLDGVHRALVDC